MKSKVLEIRDRATFIPVVATEMFPENEIQSYYLRHSGYGFDYPLVLVTTLDGRECEYDPFKWGTNPRTMFEAHMYIQEHFNELNEGDVVDVEYILGEAKEAKKSQRFDKY